MNGLKAYTYDDMLDGTADVDVEYYLKSEADKVIAELEGRIADGDRDFELANHQNEMLLKIVRHHKYRRCLAMAGRCRLRARWFGDNAFYKKEQWALKWHRRWLVLAEKFKDKEANNA